MEEIFYGLGLIIGTVFVIAFVLVTLTYIGRGLAYVFHTTPETVGSWFFTIVVCLGVAFLVGDCYLNSPGPG